MLPPHCPVIPVALFKVAAFKSTSGGWVVWMGLMDQGYMHGRIGPEWAGLGYDLPGLAVGAALLTTR